MSLDEEERLLQQMDAVAKRGPDPTEEELIDAITYECEIAGLRHLADLMGEPITETIQ